MLAFDKHFERTQQEASDVAQELRRQGHDRDIRVATWMLVGNGAALLACFNAVIGGNISSWQQVQSFALVFFLGMVCAVASVVFEGEAESKAISRLILLSSASRRAALCIDANSEFRAEQARRAGPSPEVDERIRANNEVIADAQRILGTQSAEPKWEKMLHRAGRVVLGISALCLGGALYVAINGGAVEAAMGR